MFITSFSVDVGLGYNRLAKGQIRVVSRSKRILGL